MRRIPPRDEPPQRRARRDLPRPEGPFERLLRQRPQRDPAPIIIGGTIAFLALVIVAVFVFSSVLGGGSSSSNSSGGSGGCAEIAPGIKGCLRATPTLPPGLSAVSRYIEFETDQPGTGADISLPLTETPQDATGLGFYTFQSNRWQRVLDVNLTTSNTRGQGDFQPLPSNLAILKVAAQAYIVGAALPAGTSLHPDAGVVQMVSPRDYTPLGDGSIQGTATQVAREGATQLIPTIVGSSQDTASVVNDILKDENLRATHVQKISELVANNGLDGIDLEYSSVNPDNAAAFTAFVQAVASELHRTNKKLTLTLPPPTNQRSAYEWQKLGSAADYLRILPIADPVAYWQTMPDALGKLSDEVDTHKILLMVSPFAIQGTNEVSQPIGYLQAMVLASSAAIREPTDPKDYKVGTEIQLVAKNLDQSEGASPLTWNQDALAVSFSLGGTEHERIFIENSYSVGFKLELVQAYALGGLVVADGSGSSDVADIWPKVRELIDSATVTLQRPNDQMLQTVWQAPDGGTLKADAGATAASWTPAAEGEQKVILVVSDGDRRFGQAVTIPVGQGEKTPTPSPLETFAPSETPGASPTGTPTPFPTPQGNLRVEVGKLADGDDDGGGFSNDETVTPGSEVTYLITIDNDSDVSVTVTSIVDSVYPNIVCLTTPGDGNVVGAVIAPDDGDGPGVLDGGADEIQCIFQGTAPEGSGHEVTDDLAAIVEDADGNTATDHDTATITTS